MSDDIGHRHSRSLSFQGAFRDRIEMLLSAQTFVGQVLVSTFPVAAFQGALAASVMYSQCLDFYHPGKCLLFPGGLI